MPTQGYQDQNYHPLEQWHQPCYEGPGVSTRKHVTEIAPPLMHEAVPYIEVQPRATSPSGLEWVAAIPQMITTCPRCQYAYICASCRGPNDTEWPEHNEPSVSKTRPAVIPRVNAPGQNARKARWRDQHKQPAKQESAWNTRDAPSSSMSKRHQFRNPFNDESTRCSHK